MLRSTIIKYDTEEESGYLVTVEDDDDATETEAVFTWTLWGARRVARRILRRGLNKRKELIEIIMEEDVA